MYSWLQFSLATACGLIAWWSLHRVGEPQPSEEASVSR
jgi:hypothetical protein